MRPFIVVLQRYSERPPLAETSYRYTYFHLSFNFVMKLSQRVLLAAILAATGYSAGAQAVTFTMRVPSVGVRPYEAATPAPTPTPEQPAEGVATGSLVPLSSTDFGTTTVGQASELTFRFSNTGTAAAPDLRAVLSANSELSLGANTCGATGATTSVAAGDSCDVTVVYQPTTAAALFGTLAIGGTYSNSPASVSLTGQGEMPAMSAIGSLVPNTTADFGNVAAGSSASRSFTFSNTGNADATGVYANISATTGLSITSNSCGTSGARVTIAPGGSCSITLAYGGSTTSSLTGASLRVSGTFAGSSTSQALSGSIGGFKAAGAWSTSGTALVAPTSTSLAVGTKTTGTSNIITVWLRRTTTSSDGLISAGFTLSGDTSQFKVLQIYAVDGSNYQVACANGSGVVGASYATACMTNSTNHSVRLVLEYAPTVVGNHTITVTPNTNNGTALPAPITYTARGEWNPTATWSTSYSSLAAPSAANLNFGTQTVGASAQKGFVLLNRGTNGEQSTGFTLSGDTSQFKITTLRLVADSGGNSSCVSGGTIAANGLSATPCLTSSAYDNVQVYFTYAPTAVGDHSITVTPTTNNGTALQGPITLTGRGEWNPTATWSTSYSSLAAPTAAYLNFGAQTVGTSVSKTFVLRDQGTNGLQSTGFELSGDTAQFKIIVVRLVADSGGNANCVSGGVIAANQLSSTYCLASAANDNVQMAVQYTPTNTATHSITITPSTNNGTILQGPITLTGSGK